MAGDQSLPQESESRFLKVRACQSAKAKELQGAVSSSGKLSQWSRERSPTPKTSGLESVRLQF